MSDSPPLVDGFRAAAHCALTLLLGLALPSAAAAPSAAPWTQSGNAEPQHPRLVVLGIDGLDPDILAETMQRFPEGMANFRWLEERCGGIRALGTSNPPQSPVAWNNFITGRDPGGHGVFDFLHRDPASRIVKGSTTRSGPSSFFGLIPGAEVTNRSGQPFWQLLAEKGIPADIWRMPCNFPVETSLGLSFSDMFTPAIDSAYGEATLFTTDPFARGQIRSSKVVDDLIEVGGVIRTNMLGPDKADGTRSKAPLTIYLDDQKQGAVLDTGLKRLPLRVGQWSSFAEFSFKLDWKTSISGVARFYLRSLEPRFELYASPVNIDPRAPATPVSQPETASADLADQIGTYYTQGMAEDVNALKDGILTPEEFLAQNTLVYKERRRMLDQALDRYLAKPEGGLLFFYFSSVDLGSHMLWRFADPQHPDHASDYYERDNSPWTEREGSRWKDVIMDLYLRMDPVVGKLRQRLEGSGQAYELMLISDHGFAPYYREFSLNTWLLEQGFLVLKEGQEREAEPRFVSQADQRSIDRVVDWSRTRAYGMGFNGLYLNLAGREGDNPRTKDVVEAGIVDPKDAPALLAELKAKLEAWVDPETGHNPVRCAYLASETYRGTERIAEAPDILVGYAVGYDNSDAASVGRIPLNVVQDNLGGTFNGSHLMDPAVVPGTLLTTLPLELEDPNLTDATAEILAFYRLPADPAMVGRPFSARPSPR
jgi:predicted AlkP superfamily phosphohydrolase/phosphomutase